jgi:hypothetical protein
MDFYQKYMKYKTKYFNLRNQTGGAGELKVIFLNDSAVRKILEEDTRLVDKLKEAERKINKYITEYQNLQQLKDTFKPKPAEPESQNGGLFQSSAKKELEKAQKQVKKAEDKTQKEQEKLRLASEKLSSTKETSQKKVEESIRKEETEKINKLKDKLNLIKKMIDETPLQTTKCNILENGMPFYNSLTLKEKLTFKIEDLPGVYHTFYGKKMKIRTNKLSDKIDEEVDLTKGYGENYNNLKDIVEKINTSNIDQNINTSDEKKIRLIIIVKDFAGSPDLFICCFYVKWSDDKTKVDRIGIFDSFRLQEKFKDINYLGREGKKIKSQIETNINELVKSLPDELKQSISEIFNQNPSKMNKKIE